MGVLSGGGVTPDTTEPEAPDTDDAPEPEKPAAPIIEDVPRESRRSKAAKQDEALTSEIAALKEKASRFEEIDKERIETREKVARLEGEIAAARAQANKPNASDEDKEYAAKITALRARRWEAIARNDATAVDQVEDEIIDLKAGKIADARLAKERASQKPPAPAWVTRLESEHPEVAENPDFLDDVDIKYRALLRSGKMPGRETGKLAFEAVEKVHGLKAPVKPRTEAGNPAGRSFAGMDSRPASESGEASIKVELPGNWKKIAHSALFRASGQSDADAEEEYKQAYAKANPHKVRRSA